MCLYSAHYVPISGKKMTQCTWDEIWWKFIDFNVIYDMPNCPIYLFFLPSLPHTAVPVMLVLTEASFCLFSSQRETLEKCHRNFLNNLSLQVVIHTAYFSELPTNHKHLLEKTFWSHSPHIQEDFEPLGLEIVELSSPEWIAL